MKWLMPETVVAAPVSRGRWVLLALFALSLLVMPSPASAQSDSGVVWEQYDVTIDVRSDGTMHVTEYQVITFEGQFSSGFAYIPLSHVEDIDNVTISVANSVDETPQPLDYVSGSRYDADEGTYTYGEASGEMAIDYGFEPTAWYSGDTTRVVVLEYEVIGGIRVYEDLDPANQQVWWYAISQDVTDVAPVRKSTVTINLPEPVAADDLVAFPDNPTLTDTSAAWQAFDLGEGDEFEVSLQFPPITDAEAPAWQRADDERRQAREEAQERSDWAGFLLLIAGLVGTFGGGIAVLALWFTKGRDPHIGMVAEYIETPPDDLRPGAVGTLLDETFHSRDVVATVLDLANRGVIAMGPKEGISDTSSHAAPYSFTLNAHNETLRGYEREVLEVIFGSNPEAGKEVTMPTVAGSLASRNDVIAKGFYQELLDHQYFSESPERARTRWRRIFKATPLVMAAAVIAIVALAGAWSNFAFFPLVVGLVVMIAASRLANAMPKKSVAGAESAAKWRAFRAYLKDLQKREDVEGSKELFEKYLPYAVAFGMAESWVKMFAFVRTPTPTWYGGGMPGGGTVIIDNRRRGTTRRTGGNWTQGPYQGMPGGGTTDGGAGSGDGWSIPSLQESSDTAAGGLQSGSDSFFSMLGTIAEAFSESSGGGSGSFGSSGSRKSFSGGGSRGGGSRSSGGGGGGGGRRGFR